MPEPDRAQLKLRDVSAVSAIDAHEHELGPSAVRAPPAPALEQLLELRWRRVRNERAHPPGAYRRRRGLSACSVTFTFNAPRDPVIESR